ncbi:hypothetical protein T190607A02C_10125 [Tenacibaculum sp. 190524A02b]
MLTVPLLKTFVTRSEDFEGEWENVYIFEELGLTLLFLPLLVLTLLTYFFKKKIIYWFLVFAHYCIQY